VKTIAQIQIRESSNQYQVYAEASPAKIISSIWRPQWRRAVIIADSNTVKLFTKPIEDSLTAKTDHVLTLEFPAGENSKTRETKEKLEDSMLEQSIGRDSCIIAVGGGVVLDLAGFVAATYMRGIPHINVATSLLAQVDAAVGGKTGINTPSGKNLVGAFHSPEAVILDTNALQTLPRQETLNGLAEAIKHAVIADHKLFKAFEKHFDVPDNPISDSLLSRCVQIKAEVVEKDFRESNYRQILNFGHTIAHAIEKAENYNIQHGLAVSMGMVVEAQLACQLNGFPVDQLERLKTLLSKAGLPIHPPCDFDQAEPYFIKDKKVRDHQIRFALPQKIGQMNPNQDAWSQPASLEQVRQAWEAI
jgi:3-dehydroquinate synthase